MDQRTDSISSSAALTRGFVRLALPFRGWGLTLQFLFMTRKQPFIVVLILGALTTIGPFSIDMYLPGFPSIAKDLHTSVAQVQLSLTSYFIGISVGQLLYGPLLDRYGRKRPLYIGMMVYILASIGCVFIHSVNSLIGMRFLQAIGG